MGLWPNLACPGPEKDTHGPSLPGVAALAGGLVAAAAAAATMLAARSVAAATSAAVPPAPLHLLVVVLSCSGAVCGLSGEGVLLVAHLEGQMLCPLSCDSAKCSYIYIVCAFLLPKERCYVHVQTLFFIFFILHFTNITSFCVISLFPIMQN